MGKYDCAPTTNFKSKKDKYNEIVICKTCGKEFTAYKSKKRQYCSYSCGRECTQRESTKQKISKSLILKNLVGEKAYGWKGGITEHRGYESVTCKSHPYSTTTGYVRKHRLVVEYCIGRYLYNNEVIHHLDGDTHNNNIENLMLLTRSDHARLNCLIRYDRISKNERMSRYVIRQRLSK
jgi:hypothetical protein